ncbi:hypothetical protein AAC387_Pa08g1059 [Persea americana]
MAIGPGGRGHAPERHRAHEMPPARNPAEVKVACLTLWLLGLEAESMRLQQPTSEAGAMRQKGVGPTRSPNQESSKGKGYIANFATTRLGGRAHVPVKTGP